MVITSQKLIPFRIQLSSDVARERPSHVDPNTRVLRARSRLRARVYGIRRIRNELFAKFMQICMDRTRYAGAGGERDGNAPTRTSLTFMKCSHAALSFFSYRTSSVRLFARFPIVSAQLFTKAKFYRVDEPACMPKADNEIAMNTNCVRKVEVVFDRRVDVVIFKRLRFVGRREHTQRCFVSDSFCFFYV